MQSLCELPLLSGVRILGSLIFMSSKKTAYGHLQHSFLEQVASAVAVALDDCLAHEEVLCTKPINFWRRNWMRSPDRPSIQTPSRE